MKTEKLTLIAGPCVVEDYETTYQTAATLKELCAKYDIDFVFKASYRKANRTNVGAFESIGHRQALEMLQQIKHTLGIVVTTDIHSVMEATYMNEFDIDIVQIPAFLCRQTDILTAAALTGKIVNIKKGQFADMSMMIAAYEKVKTQTDNDVWLTERGTTFGYNDLIVDLRFIYMLKAMYNKVFVDVTHSMGVLGGYAQAIEAMSLASIAAGASGLFIETHPSPITALSDGGRMVPLVSMNDLIAKVMNVWNATRP